MSFDDYANHIYQKHRLAVALAILKSKPTNLKTDDYLKELKSKIDHKMDDDEITICSDDFLMDDDDDEMNDSVTILKDFDPKLVNNDENSWTVKNAASEKPPNIPEVINKKISENLSQITYCDGIQSQHNAIIVEPLNSNVTLSQDVFNFNQKLDIEESIPTNVITEEFNDKIRTVDQNTDIQTYYDSQKTLLYTVHGFTENYTHYSPSQAEIIIPNKYLYNVNKNTCTTNQNKNINKENNIVIANRKDFDSETQFGKKGNSLNIKTPTNRDEFEYIQTMNMFTQDNNDNFDEIQNNIRHSDSERYETMNDINIIINKETENSSEQISTQYSQNIDEYFEDNDIRTSFPTENNTQNTHNMETNDVSFGYSQNTEYLSQNKEISQTRNELDKASNAEKLIENSEKHYQHATIASVNDSSDKPRREEDEFESEEIISYKVLEEFNKVKSFLKKQNRRMSCDGYSTDSGYKSDSQRSNRSALQLSGTWLNQSGCCLFNYIMQCHLVVTTRDITNEIAQVLSQLIDRLHEEEKYPSFLEELLETVEILLRQVYEGESGEDGEFLKKDENIQRILLLNKSIHIQKHSIEKITNILETFHTKVTEIDSAYELSNIDKMENITYIFHILEILLKKYMKNREVLSQVSTQNSQDDEKVFKKSSITDIWRKKWNPSQKSFEGSREKKCVLKNCSEILNKIVVECVSSYSLVAFSALKCFNSMQV